MPYLKFLPKTLKVVEPTLGFPKSLYKIYIYIYILYMITRLSK